VIIWGGTFLKPVRVGQGLMDGMPDREFFYFFFACPLFFYEKFSGIRKKRLPWFFKKDSAGIFLYRLS
jgi:hypothetical protein